MRSEVLFIGGRSGVGKTSAAVALHDLLTTRDIPHAVIEGDNLDLAHPAPHVAHHEFGLAERNLTAMWDNYKALGYHRLVYTNTVSVLELDLLSAAMGDHPHVTAVLLQASDEAAASRLHHRADGHPDPAEIARSARSALELDSAVGHRVHRLDTTTSSATKVADRLAALARWIR